MEQQFRDIINEAVGQLPVRDKEKEEIAEEMVDHLELLKQEYMAEGESEPEAVAHAINAFGSGREIGRELRRSMFPHLRLLQWIGTVFALFLAYFLVRQGLALHQLGTDVDGDGIGIHFFIFEINDRVPESQIPGYAFSFLLAGTAAALSPLLFFNKLAVRYFTEVWKGV